ncbi:MAG TPA: hypothetical protein VI547_01505 [Anaerolineales bacterium]|nr:hypothetical protein [Anaerolineales bacterium]
MTEEHRPTRPPAEPLTEGRIDFAYAVFWTKTVRGWDAGARQQIAARLTALVESPDFLNNAFERKYTIEGLDDLAHSGASLLALRKVLQAME